MYIRRCRCRRYSTIDGRDASGEERERERQKKIGKGREVAREIDRDPQSDASLNARKKLIRRKYEIDPMRTACDITPVMEQQSSQATRSVLLVFARLVMRRGDRVNWADRAG